MRKMRRVKKMRRTVKAVVRAEVKPEVLSGAEVKPEARAKVKRRRMRAKRRNRKRRKSLVAVQVMMIAVVKKAEVNREVDPEVMRNKPLYIPINVPYKHACFFGLSARGRCVHC